MNLPTILTGVRKQFFGMGASAALLSIVCSRTTHWRDLVMAWIAVSCPQCGTPLPRLAALACALVKCDSYAAAITKTESVVTRDLSALGVEGLAGNLAVWTHCFWWMPLSFDTIRASGGISRLFRRVVSFAAFSGHDQTFHRNCGGVAFFARGAGLAGVTRPGCRWSRCLFLTTHAGGDFARSRGRKRWQAGSGVAASKRFLG